MRFSATVACLTACLASAEALSVFNGKAPNALASDDGTKVPGESPLEFCTGEHGNDIVKIEKVDLSPNPPAAGKELVIEASGIVNETIEKGAYVLLTVKYGLIRLVNTKADLCEQIGNVDLKCPLEKGKMVIRKTVDLPKEIPPGTYSVLADVYTANDKKITCLTATVTFKVGNGFFSNEL
ncbi:Phosphatidylglycerol/phosphatidylinositol transfer protein [Purpureocillium takamizusanense]|uniref:Phosphatidylglycerol/phosphatidylinositol transfer protein n=1 Tax=Purpureocillium takamizusanense TaxID=2060973 RepID=A0A9Q8QJ15_9HYPO|nr:Phosphatidylglycerol/phosphatidylinositol transfer protein [Purpureocillium takamizusanense]UNI21909.1 Phosphatidylglycerol/phosphatidylinositol transfer protein [Purpureocillium takamizusanense]